MRKLRKPGAGPKTMSEVQASMENMRVGVWEYVRSEQEAGRHPCEILVRYADQLESGEIALGAPEVGL